MWKTIFPIVCSLLVVCVAGGATSQTLNRVVLNNRSYDSVYVIAYDPTCRIRVYEGVLAEGSSITVRVCASDRRLGNLIVYDVRGRNLSFSKLRDGSQVSVRFRRRVRFEIGFSGVVYYRGLPGVGAPTPYPAG